MLKQVPKDFENAFSIHRFYDSKTVQKISIVVWTKFIAMIFFLQNNKRFLNLILEYIPLNIRDVCKYYNEAKKIIPMLYIKVSFIRS